MVDGAGGAKHEYKAIDPQARGFDAVRASFSNQIAYCRANGSPITADVCEVLLGLINQSAPSGGAVIAQVRSWEGPALADALPLRVAGGIHALHLSGGEPALLGLYEAHEGFDTSLAIGEALIRHKAFLMPWLDGPPQTNEAGRSAGLIACLVWLSGRGLPPRFALKEIGSSAGINLMMAHYAYRLGKLAIGAKDPAMQFAPEWTGNSPTDAAVTIVDAKGCDVAPLDLNDPNDALRLKAFIWPEFSTRFDRMNAAIVLAASHPPKITQASAADFVQEVLAEVPEAGTTRVIMHSVVWQYLNDTERYAVTQLIEAAGAKGTKQAPLAWIALEANRDTHRHELVVRYWNGDTGSGEAFILAHAHPHGAWIKWLV